MPPRIPNFPAHASRDVWQDRWLSPRSSRIAGSAPGATPHDRTPALPRVARGGALASPADGSAPVDERLRLGRGALSECLQAGAGAQGCSQHASPAPPAHPRAPPRGPVAVVDPQPMEPMRLLRLGLPVASAARSPRPALPPAPPGSPCSCRACSAAGICRARGPRGGREGQGEGRHPDARHFPHARAVSHRVPERALREGLSCCVARSTGGTPFVFWGGGTLCSN